MHCGTGVDANDEMRCTISGGERLVRLVVGSLLAAVGLWEVGGLLHGPAAIAVGTVGMVLIVTGTLGHSPGCRFRHRSKERPAGE